MKITGSITDRMAPMNKRQECCRVWNLYTFNSAYQTVVSGGSAPWDGYETGRTVRDSIVHVPMTHDAA